MANEEVFSADSHVIEPGDLWTARIDHHFLDRAPKTVKQVGRHQGDFFVAEGIRPFPVAGFAVAGVDPKDYPAKMAGGYPGVRPSGWDPVERIKDQHRDGVSGEVLYPSLGMRLYGMEDGALRAASFRAYNDWLADYCAHAPGRLLGIALISLDDTAEGGRELERAARKGLRGALIWAEPPAERPYSDASYENFWAAAAAVRLPVSLHILTERRAGAQASIMRSYPSMHHCVERSLIDLIFGGVLERHPALRLVSVENDIGWIAHFLQRLDHSWEKYRYMEKARSIDNPPSFYFRRQVGATFQDDRVGVLTRHSVGVDNLMWASDFPHSDSTWPNSHATIAREFDGVPPEERRKMVCDNARALYGVRA